VHACRKVLMKIFLLLVNWIAEFPLNGYLNRIGPYISIDVRSHCACLPQSLGVISSSF
jgi:hypothetical protein